jgi:hypothetical protein
MITACKGPNDFSPPTAKTGIVINDLNPAATDSASATAWICQAEVPEPFVPPENVVP